THHSFSDQISMCASSLYTTSDTHVHQPSAVTPAYTLPSAPEKRSLPGSAFCTAPWLKTALISRSGSAAPSATWKLPNPLRSMLPLIVAVVALAIVVTAPTTRKTPEPEVPMLPPVIATVCTNTVPSPITTLPPLTVSGPMVSTKPTNDPPVFTVTAELSAIWLLSSSLTTPPLIVRSPATARTLDLVSSS